MSQRTFASTILHPETDGSERLATSSPSIRIRTGSGMTPNTAGIRIASPRGRRLGGRPDRHGKTVRRPISACWSKTTLEV